MTYDMAPTRLKGFPVQYGSNVVQHLNEVVNPRNFNNAELKEIGKAVSPDVKHTMNCQTEDGYYWFGMLEYKLNCWFGRLECEPNGAKVAVLFPCTRDFNPPETRMDRSINVYSNKKLPDEVVKNLLRQIASQLELAIKPQRRN